MEKDFTAWTQRKRHLHQRTDLPHFNQGDIWWCSIGVNIGHEQDGKHADFSRPVIVIRKLNTHLFVGVPLTTQLKHHPYSQRVKFKGREQCALLSQVRLWDSRRLTTRMGRLSATQFDTVRLALKAML